MMQDRGYDTTGFHSKGTGKPRVVKIIQKSETAIERARRVINCMDMGSARFGTSEHVTQIGLAVRDILTHLERLG